MLKFRVKVLEKKPFVLYSNLYHASKRAWVCDLGLNASKHTQTIMWKMQRN